MVNKLTIAEERHQQVVTVCLRTAAQLVVDRVAVRRTCTPSFPCARRSPKSITGSPCAAQTIRCAFVAISVWKLMKFSSAVSTICASRIDPRTRSSGSIAKTTPSPPESRRRRTRSEAHRGLAAFHRGLTAFHRGLTAFHRGLTAFRRCLTVFPNGLTVFPNGLTVFPHGLTVFLHGLTVFLHGLTVFLHGLTVFPRGLTLFPRGLTVLPRADIVCPRCVMQFPNDVKRVPTPGQDVPASCHALTMWFHPFPAWS